MDKDMAKAIVDLANQTDQELEVRIYEGYSGRCMYDTPGLR